MSDDRYTIYALEKNAETGQIGWIPTAHLALTTGGLVEISDDPAAEPGESSRYKKKRMSTRENRVVTPEDGRAFIEAIIDDLSRSTYVSIQSDADGAPELERKQG